MVNRRQEIIRGLVLLAAFVIAFVGMSMCQAATFDEKTKAILDEADSLKDVITFREGVDREKAALVQQLTIEKHAAQDSARTARAEADRLRAQRLRVVPVASQPGAAPTVSDTLRAIEVALETCDEETKALRAASTQDSTALARAAETEAAQAGRLAARDSSIVELRGVVNRLSSQLEAADPPCRVAFFSCPSRKTVFIVGVGLGAGITWSLTR